MGQVIYNILNFIRDSKKNYVVFAHNEIAYDAEGNKINKVRSFGKLLDEKTEMPSMFTTVLVPVVKRGQDKIEYVFQTQSDSYNFAKSPAKFNQDGNAVPALPFEVPNDIKLVFDLLDKFENEEE
jgi:Zn-dependent M28 family amino/carboxypeptidase